MKKIYFIVSLAVIALLSSCSEDYNEHNFPGYKDAAIPTNVVSYTYTLTDADYTTIATAIKKPVNDSLTLLKTKLKTASKTDSVTLNSSIARLNLKLTTDSTYIKATYIGSNKLFNSKMKAADYIPYLLDVTYKYTDKGSNCTVIYNNADIGDTLSIAAANRFTLTAADYLSMGTGTNQPGQYKNFSTVMPVMTYLNQYLKIKCAYAQTNDVKVVSYLYYDSNKVSKMQYRILTFDGQNWINGSGQYVNNGTIWLFDPSIYVTMKKGLNATDDYMLVVNYIKANQGVTTPSLLGYYGTTLEYEYYYGFLAYYGEISWKETDRKFDPDYVKLTTVDEKVAFLTQRTQEGLAVYLALKYPDAQPQVNGIDLYCYITTTLYYEFTATTSTTSTTNYRYKYQRIDNGKLKWKYVDRVKL
jgi:hypothetical protein